MSYGAAINRDARRQSALKRFESKIQAYNDLIAEARKKKNPIDTKAAAEYDRMISIYIAKRDAHLEVVQNTQKNLGKGSAAMGGDNRPASNAG